MGVDRDLLTDPDGVSKHLLCPICHDVLEKAVQTPGEHLYCDECLLEWLTDHDTDPMTNLPLAPSDVTPCSRIISNMVSELRCRCMNHESGCEWTGELGQLAAHAVRCDLLPREKLLLRMRAAESEAALLRARVDKLERKSEEEQQTILLQAEQVSSLTAQLAAQNAALTIAEELSYSSDDDEDEEGEEGKEATQEAINAIKACNLEQKTLQL